MVQVAWIGGGRGNLGNEYGRFVYLWNPPKKTNMFIFEPHFMNEGMSENMSPQFRTERDQSIFWPRTKVHLMQKTFFIPYILHITFSNESSFLSYLSFLEWFFYNSKMPRLGKPSCKKMFSFGHCLKWGGERETPARICWPFFHHVVPYILTSISFYVILFGHF